MTQEEARRGRWAVAAMFFVNGLIMGVWAPQIPLLLPRHQISESILGLLILVLGVGAISAMFFAGRLITKFGVVPMVRFFAVTSVLALPMVIFAPNLYTLAAAMAVMGGVIGCMDVSMNANAVDIERRLGRAIMSSSHGFWSLGGFIGGASGAWLLEHFGYTAQVLITMGVAMVIVLLAMPMIKSEPRQAETDATDAPVKTSLIPKVPGLWLLGVMCLFSMIPEGAVLDWAALFIASEFGSSAFVAGLGFAFFSGAMALMRFAGDTVRNKFGAVRTLRLSALLAAVGLLVASVAPVDGLAIAAFCFAGLGVANLVPIMFSAAGNYPGLPSGVGISTVAMVGYAGILIAPASIGFAAEHFGYRLTYGALSLLLLFVALMATRAKGADDLQTKS